MTSATLERCSRRPAANRATRPTRAPAWAPTTPTWQCWSCSTSGAFCATTTCCGTSPSCSPCPSPFSSGTCTLTGKTDSQAHGDQDARAAREGSVPALLPPPTCKAVSVDRQAPRSRGQAKPCHAPLYTNRVSPVPLTHPRASVRPRLQTRGVGLLQLSGFATVSLILRCAATRKGEVLRVREQAILTPTGRARHSAAFGQTKDFGKWNGKHSVIKHHPSIFPLNHPCVPRGTAARCRGTPEYATPTQSNWSALAEPAGHAPAPRTCCNSPWLEQQEACLALNGCALALGTCSRSR